MRAVEVRWIDTHSASTSWCAPRDIENQQFFVSSIGYLVENAKVGHIVIAQSWIEDSDLLDSYLAIPHETVVAVIDLSTNEVVKFKRKRNFTTLSE